MSPLKKLLACLLLVGGVSVVVTINVQVDVNPPGPPVPVEELGWREELVPEAAAIVAGMPPFQIVGDVGDNARENVRLWEAAKQVNGGDHLPNYPQQVGDCVSFGAKNAIEYLQATQLAVALHGGLGRHAPRGPPSHDFAPVFPPYIYGTSRVQIGGGRLKGDGSVGAWAAEAVREYGVLQAQAPGVPAYSGSVARDWGRNGPPAELIRKAQQFPVRTVSHVTTPEEVRDALCHGYPVTIASSFGSENFDVKDGRHVARGDGRWAHQMCLVGYDGSANEPYWYCLNSWGPKAHPEPLQGEPPGGFWITESQLRQILRAKDSFAFSNFEGFPSRLDFRVIARPADHPQPPAGAGNALALAL